MFSCNENPNLPQPLTFFNLTISLAISFHHFPHFSRYVSTLRQILKAIQIPQSPRRPVVQFQEPRKSVSELLNKTIGGLETLLKEALHVAR
jgi:hypothetical protein